MSATLLSQNYFKLTLKKKKKTYTRHPKQQDTLVSQFRILMHWFALAVQ